MHSFVDRARRVLGWMFAAAGLTTASLPVAAQDVTQYQDDGKLFRGQMQPSTLGPGLFGDQVSLYTGGVEFVQQDVSLPGNNALPVAVGRRYVTGYSRFGGMFFGDWDLEIPRIHATFATQTGWRMFVSPASEQVRRCTNFGQEAQPVKLKNESSYYPPIPIVQMYVPGVGDQEILIRSTTDAPADGNTYPLVTRGNWQFRCLPALKGGTDSTGEGFLVKSPDGTTYRFDWMIGHRAKPISVPGPNARMGKPRPPQTATPGGDTKGNTAPNAIATWPQSVTRTEYWLVPTSVTDRHGNTVTYTYSAANPYQLLTIQSSDGRTLTLGYVGTDGAISTVFDGTRTWSYGYTNGELASVRLPDASSWQFSGDSLQRDSGTVNYSGQVTSCYGLSTAPGTSSGGYPPTTRTFVHPSGAVGQFVTGEVAHGLTYVGDCAVGWSHAPLPFFHSRALLSKTISGPGLPAQTWRYVYPQQAATGYLPCVGCPDRKAVIVTDPRGYATRHVFGTRWHDNEGLLLQMDEGWDGSAAVRSTTYRYRSPTAGPYPATYGTSSGNGRGDVDMAVLNRPQDLRSITQQGVNFRWEAPGFDSRARPTRVVKTGPSGARTELSTYKDHTGLWVLGQLETVTDQGTGLVAARNDYHPVTALRTATYSFGRPLGRYEYNTDGTLAIAYDPAGRPTRFSEYKRGIAQLIVYPDRTSERAVVNDIGLITLLTNAAGTTAGYGYDRMGRLARITPPAGDPAPYNDTTLVFEPVSVAEAGLSPVHWRQTVTTGKGVTVRYFDALWRTVLTRTLDTDDPNNTARTVLTRYDIDGRKTFESYPARSIATVDSAADGTTWQYDALGRVVWQGQNSELGPLVTTTEYLPGFQRRVTNPRRFATTYAFQAFDTPSEDAISMIWAPEAVTVAIGRDIFGKPTFINRSGGTPFASATRSYFYDGYQRLCKTIEPETQSTVQDYDPAGNLAWRATGLALPAASCDTISVPETRKIRYDYDERNRLKLTAYGDGSPSIWRTYTPDGLPLQVWTNGANASTWTYGYNNRRLLVAESLVHSGLAQTTAWGIDANGKVTSMTYPNGMRLDMAPNALGEPRLLSTGNTVLASGIVYHPNGAVAGYTLGNGKAHSVTQNLRGLPSLWTDVGVLQDQYTYDAHGNVSTITDQTGGGNSRAMGYDRLDRLAVATGPWGMGRYGYDALDNLRSSSVGTRNLTHLYDAATNRLSGVSGSLAASLGYDLNGNVSQVNTQSYGFDLGNRLVAVRDIANYAYDGHGRRIKVTNANGSGQTYVYSQFGQLLMSRRTEAPGSPVPPAQTLYVHLAGKLIAEYNDAAAPVGGLRFVHGDALGSPVAKTSVSGTVEWSTRYEPYGGTAGGATPQGWASRGM